MKNLSDIINNEPVEAGPAVSTEPYAESADSKLRYTREDLGIGEDVIV